MRKIILAFMFFSFYSIVNAQNENSDNRPYTYYLSMRGYQNFSGAIDAIIELNEKGDYYICDDNGLEKAFNSVMHIFNFLSKLGWSYVEGHPVSNTGYHYTFKKEVKNDDEVKQSLNLRSLEEIKNTKKELKKK